MNGAIRCFTWFTDSKTARTLIPIAGKKERDNYGCTIQRRVGQL